MSDTPADHRPPSPPRRGRLLREMVGAELRRIRLDQRRTLAEVAAAANLSLAYLSEIERGLKEASSEVLAALCAALGIQLGDLLDGVQFELERARPDQSIISVIPTAPTVIPTTPPGRYAGPTMCAA